MVYQSALKVAPSAARLQLELDRLSWSPWCGDTAEGWDGEVAHSRWPGNVLENANLTIKIRIVLKTKINKYKLNKLVFV